MSGKTRRNVAFMSVLVMVLVVSFISTSSAKANGGPWTGEPDPYLCNHYLDCNWTVTVCINDITHVVGIYYDPTSQTDEYMEADAFGWSGITLTIGKCEFHYTDRWVHSYAGTTWTCNLISEAGEDKDAPRFSDINYVKAACGEHPVFGPFDGTADYVLCREKSANGVLYCGNHYDTSQ